MTLNQIYTLFQDIATKHKQIKTFGSGEEWEVNQQLTPTTQFPMWFASLIDVSETENTRNFSFNMICFGNVRKDKSNENEVLSDTLSILSDLTKIFRNDSNDYDLINEPVMLPFKEKYSAFAAGHHCEMTIETDLNNNYCDVPADDLTGPAITQANWVIKDLATGDVITTLDRLHPGTYYITLLNSIEQSLDAVSPTIIQVL